MTILCTMLYSDTMESNSLYCFQLMSESKDQKTEKVHKGNTGNAGRKDGEKMIGTERKVKFTNLIYPFNPKSIVLGMKTMQLNVFRCFK